VVSRKLRYHVAAPLRWIRGVLGARAFRAVPPVEIDCTPLRRLDPSKLSAMLAPDAVLDAWTEDARTLARLALPEVTGGGVNPGDRRALHALVLCLAPRTILEIGTHVGSSTVSLALAARRVGAQIVTCDIADVNDPSRRPWLDYGSRYAPRELVTAAGCDGIVEFRTSDSLEFLGQRSPRFDLIFLDGDHTAGTVYREVPAALGALRPGGSIVLHDYYPENRPLFPHDQAIAGPFLAVERLRREGAELAVLPLGRLAWRTRAGSNVTSLAVLSRR